jgi:hypothetical protein
MNLHYRAKAVLEGLKNAFEPSPERIMLLRKELAGDQIGRAPIRGC